MVRLNDSQLRLIAETLSNLGIVFFSSLVLQFFVTELSIVHLIFGLALALTSWLASLLIIKHAKL